MVFAMFKPFIYLQSVHIRSGLYWIFVILLHVGIIFRAPFFSQHDPLIRQNCTKTHRDCNQMQFTSTYLSKRILSPETPFSDKKKLFIYPKNNEVADLISDAKNEWPQGIFKSAEALDELTDDLYIPSNIIVIIDKMSAEGLVYTIRHNVFSESYETEKYGSNFAVDKLVFFPPNRTRTGDLGFRFRNKHDRDSVVEPSDVVLWSQFYLFEKMNVTNYSLKSAEEFVIVQVAINEAYAHSFLKKPPPDWALVNYLNTPLQDILRAIAEVKYHLKFWLYFGMVGLLVKIFAASSTEIRITTTFLMIHGNNPFGFISTKILVYICICLVIAIVPYLVSNSGYYLIFPCSCYVVVVSVMFTFNVASISLVCFLSSVLMTTKKYVGPIIMMLIWYCLYAVVCDAKPANYLGVILMALIPGGGFFLSLDTLLSYEAVNSQMGLSVLTSWPEDSLTLLPLGATLFIMWISVAVYLTSFFYLIKARSINKQFFSHEIQKLKLFAVSLIRRKNVLISETCLSNVCSERTKKSVDRNVIMEAVDLRCGVEQDSTDGSVDMCVYKNEISVILGGAHSGKSRLLMVLAGIMQPFRGQLFVEGKNVLVDVMKLRRCVGFCSHRSELEGVTVKEILIFTSLLKGLCLSGARHETKILIERMGLSAFENTRFNNLSPLWKITTLLTSTLIGKPKILILDQITSDLSIVEKSTFLNIIIKLKKQFSIIYSTNSSEEVEELADRVGILDGGLLKCYDTPSVLMKQFGLYYELFFQPPTNVSPSEILDSLRDKDNKAVYTNSGNIIVSVSKESDVPNTLNLLENFLGAESSLMISSPRFEEVYCKAIGVRLYKDTKSSSPLLSDNDLPLGRGSWPKFVALFLRNFYWIWQERLVSMTSLVIVPILIGLIINRKLGLSYGQGSLPKVAVQMSDFGSTPVYVTRNKDDVLADKIESLVASQGSYVNYANHTPLNQLKQPNCSRSTEEKEYDVIFERSKMIFSINSRQTPVELYYSRNYFSSPAIGVDLIYRASGFDITTYHHPYVSIPHKCWATYAGVLKISVDSSYKFMTGNVTGCEYRHECPDSIWSDVSLVLKGYFIILAFTLSYIPMYEQMTGLKHLLVLSSVKWYIYWPVAYVLSLSFVFLSVLLLLFVNVALVFPWESLWNLSVFWFYADVIIYGVGLINLNYLVSTHTKDIKTYTAFSVLFYFCPPVICMGHIAMIVLGLLQLIMREATHTYVWEKFIEIDINSYFTYKPGKRMDVLTNVACANQHIWQSTIGRNWNLMNDEASSSMMLDASALSIIGIMSMVFYFVLIIQSERGYRCTCFHTCKMFIKNIFTKRKPPRRPSITKKFETFWTCGEVPEKPLFIVKGASGCFLLDNQETDTIVIERGQCVALLGCRESKNPYLETILGTSLPETKRFNVGKNSVYSDAIGFSPASNGLYDNMTARQHLTFFGRLRGIPSSNLKRVVDGWLETMDLASISDQAANTYDVSSKKKLSVSLSLIGTPFLVVINEPTLGVDVRSRQRILNAIDYCCRFKKQTIIIGTENLQDCSFCQQIVLLNGQRIEFIGYSQKSKITNDVVRTFSNLVFVKEDELTATLVFVDVQPRWSDVYEDMLALILMYPGELRDFSVRESAYNDVYTLIEVQKVIKLSATE